MEKLKGFKVRISNKELFRKICFWTFGDGDIDNPVVDLAGLFNIDNKYPLTPCELEDDEMKKLEAITKLKGIRCMNSYMEKWNDETNDAEYMFVVYDQYPEEIMKFISKEHGDQTLEVIRYCEYWDKKWIIEEKKEFWTNGKRKNN